LFQENNAPRKLTVWIVVALIVLVGFSHFFSHRDIPIIRNSAVYASIIDRMQENSHTFNASFDAYNKPLGFAYLSLPWVKLWGRNTGLQFSGFLCAALWVVSLVPFYRRFCKVFKAEERNLPYYILLACFNPLVLYQFMSAYPDLLFGLSFLWGMYFLDRFLSEDVKWYDGILLGMSCLFSVWVKHNGFIFLPLIVLFAIVRWRTVGWLYRCRRKEFFFGVVSLALFLIIVGLAQAGYHFDLFNLSANKRNYGRGSDHLKIIKHNARYFWVYLILSFSVLTPFIVPLKNWRKNKEWYLAVLIFLASLLYYKGTNYNLRYYLTLAPVFALLIVANAQHFPRMVQTLFLFLFVVVNSYTSIYYNSLAANEIAKNMIALPQYDNLRLVAQQGQIRRSISLVNTIQKEHNYSHLFFLSNYYHTALWYAWEKDGFFADDVKVIYADKWSEELWYECQCDEAVVYDFISRSYRHLKDKKVKAMFTPQGLDVYIVKKPVRKIAPVLE